MFAPKGHEIDRVLRASALSYLRTLTSENSNSDPATNEGANSIEASQLVDKPVVINKDLQRFKWLFGALADLVFCFVSRSDLLIDGGDIKGFRKESLLVGSSSDALKNDVLEIAKEIHIELVKQKIWKNLMDLNRKSFLSAIAHTVVDEIMRSTSNRVFLRVKLEHVYNPDKKFKDVSDSLWGRAIDANQLDTQPWYTAWIIQPTNERRTRAISLLHQAISELQTQFEIPIGSDAERSTSFVMALIVKEACRLAEISKDAEMKDFKDSTEILSAEFHTILAFEFDTSGYLSKQEFIAAFMEKLIAQKPSTNVE